MNVIDIYNASVSIVVVDDNKTVATSDPIEMESMKVYFDDAYKTYDIMGLHDLSLAFVDDDGISFKKEMDNVVIRVYVCVGYAAEFVGKMLKAIAGASNQ